MEVSPALLVATENGAVDVETFPEIVSGSLILFVLFFEQRIQLVLVGLARPVAVKHLHSIFLRSITQPASKVLFITPS